MTAPPEDPRADPNTRPCADCGHVWFAGERKHVYVADGAADERDEVICVLCQRVRERPRSEDW